MSRRFQSNPKRIEGLADIIASFNPRLVLDVGCGRGFLVEELNKRGIPAFGIDFAEAAVEARVDENIKLGDAEAMPYPDDSFDLVFSSDFFEHIPEDKIDKVYDEMKRVGRRVVARIAVLNGASKWNKYHVTVKPSEWWEERLKGIILV